MDVRNIDWYKCSDKAIQERLENVLRTKDFQFIGKFEKVPDKDFGFFKNVRSLSGVRKFYPTNDGLLDENKGRPLEIISTAYNSISDGKWYKFNTVPADLRYRREKKNPFLLQTDRTRRNDIKLLTGSELIRSIQSDSQNTPEGIAGNLMRAIETISTDINTEPTTFIFELIQNADDYPNDQHSVSISFKIEDEYLIIQHDGNSFEVNNTVAICGINEGDKREDTNKIGFKGIGFKSIFKDSNYAYIKSGDFSFRFDEEYWKQKGLELSWHITPIPTPPNKFNNVIYPESNVNILVKPKSPEILHNYLQTFLQHFKDEKILLFLRNVKKLNFIAGENSFEIENSFANWIILTEQERNVPENETGELNRKINLPDKRIPIKFRDIKITEIGFAFRRNEKQINPIMEGYISAYLPTKVKLGFPFIINGNFIPDASRTKIYSDISWNVFLFEECGELFLKQLKTLQKKGYEVNSVISLIPDFSEISKNKNDDEIEFINAFKKGLSRKLNEIKFIPTTKNNPEALSNIFIDVTGLSGFLGDSFKELTGIIESEISSDIQEFERLKIIQLVKQFGEGKIIEVGDLKIIFKKSEFRDWLLKPENNFKLIQFLNSKESLKGLLKTEEIFLSNDLELFNVKSLYSTLPENLPHIKLKKVHQKVGQNLTTYKIELDFLKFEAKTFYEKNILYQHLSINIELDSEQKLINFWMFVYDNWSDLERNKNITRTLGNFNVLCQATEGILKKEMISKTYLSNNYTSGTDLEGIIKTLGLKDAAFISAKYLNEERTASQWKKIFKASWVKTDLQDVIKSILTKLKEFEEVKHFQITEQVFRYWKSIKSLEGLPTNEITQIKNDLKILCADGEFRKPADCIISDYYNNNQVISTVIPAVQLNTVSEKYSGTANIVDWKTFFKMCGCIELEDKQAVLNKKVDTYLAAQDLLRENHFEVLQSLFKIYNSGKETGLELKFEKLCQIKLLSHTAEWELPQSIHLNASFKPTLELEKDKDIYPQIKFLNEKYSSTKFEKSFLEKLGVNSGFKVKEIEKVLHSNLHDEDYKLFLANNENFHKLIASYQGKWNYKYPITDVTFVLNHSTLNYDFLLQYPSYYSNFLEHLVKNNHFKFLENKTYISLWENRKFSNDNYIHFLLNKYPLFPTKSGSWDKPINLFSIRLSTYINNDSLIPGIDLTGKQVNEETTLEACIGINQRLNGIQCLKLLSRSQNRISHEELKSLEIISILSSYEPTDEEKNRVYLLNQKEEWKLVTDLFYVVDENFIIEPHLTIHEDFIPLIENFGIQVLSEEILILSKTPEEILSFKEIENFFITRAKYLAYKIDQTDNYLRLEEYIINKVKELEFFHVETLEKKFPIKDPVYIRELDFLIESKSKIYFTGNWKLNESLTNFLLENIVESKVPKDFFQNVLIKQEEEVITNLEFDFGEVPDSWNSLNKENTKKEIEKLDFSDEEIELLKKLIGGEIAEEISDQKEANFSASLKGLLKLDKRGFSLKNPEEFRSSNVKEFLKENGDLLQVIFRSAVKGILYLDPYSWTLLDDQHFELWIYLGKSDFKIIKSKKELLSMQFNKYNLIMLDNNNQEEDLINQLIEDAPIESVKLLFVTNQKMAAKFNLDIFNESGKITRSAQGKETFL